MRQTPHPTKCTAFRPENGLALGQTDLIPTRLPGWVKMAERSLRQ